MTLDQDLRDLGEVLRAAGGVTQRDPRMRAAQRLLLDRCAALVGVDGPPQRSLPELMRLAATAPPAPRRSCAVLAVHALGVRGVIPRTADPDVCALAEAGLRGALLRCGYPFGGSVAEKIQVLERLRGRLDELMQPLEPTFPNWQGLYAG